MKITGIRLREVTGTMSVDGVFWEDRVNRPIDVYPEYARRTAGAEVSSPRITEDGRHIVRAVFLEIMTDDGITGLAGPITHEIAYEIHLNFAGFLVGENPLATERIWDLMYRSAVHGRKGIAMMAISAIDCALWDLKGKWANAPVHLLLGGPFRTELPAYASMLGYSIEPEQAAERAREMVSQGYRAMKWFPRGGPIDGRAGMNRIVELMRALREAVGPDIDIMLDAWMSWDVPFTLAVAERIAPYDPSWIEEPVLPDKIAASAEIRHRSPVPIATGEHEYTRYGIRELLDAGAMDILQPDTYWAGGISELQKIFAVASTYDIPVIPHGHSVPANAQLSAAVPIPAVPYVEFLVKWNAVHQFFWQEPLVPVNGMITVPDRPGMGMAIDEAKVETSRVLFTD